MHPRSDLVRVAVRFAGAALVALAALTVSGHSDAQDRELSDAPDFRVRVQAALRLGRAGGDQSRVQLERGLSDAHPAVRVACAVGLSTIGDPKSIHALEHAAKRESFASVRTAMRDAVAKIRANASHAAPHDPAAGLDRAKYVVQLGNMRNVSGVRNTGLDDVMRQAARAKASTIRGAYVVDGADDGALHRASKKHIPVLLLDGTLTRLTQSRGRDGGVIVSARVDMSIRRMPQQTLTGTVSGNASASDDARSAAKGMAELQARAVGGAVESAISSVGSSIASLTK